MVLYFITGNKNKFEEVQKLIPEIEHIDMDLPEIQEIDSKEIIREKLFEALKHKDGEFVVEDTSLYLDCLGDLPGPLIKWFMQALGNKGIFELVKKYGDYGAEAKTMIGYVKEGEIYFFEGSLRGKIVSPDTPTNFGWDPLFQPEGFSKSFAEMSQDEKNKISMRKVAFGKLKEFLDEKKR